MTATSELILGLLWTWVAVALLFTQASVPDWTSGMLAAVLAVGHLSESRR